MEVVDPKKIRKTKRSRQDTDRSIDLRPCEVCGGKSSGVHFGAITCEACKSFFSRAIKHNLTYTCFSDDLGKPCVIRLVKGGIVPCSACRLKRCLEINMSPQAIKKGRYTHLKKAEAIQKSKTYWKKQAELKNLSFERQDKSIEYDSNILQPNKAIDIDILHNNLSGTSDNRISVRENKLHHPIEKPNLDLIDVTVTSSEPMTEIERELLSGDYSTIETLDDILERGDENAHIDRITDTVTKAFDAQNFLSKSYLSKVSVRQLKHFTKRQLSEQLFGTLAFLPKEDHRKLYKETGIDIDGRIDVLNDFIRGLETQIPKFIKFIKAIPGFESFSLEEQVAMIKNSNYVQLETIFFPCINLEVGIATDPFNSNELDLKLFASEYQMKTIRHIIQLLQAMDLSDKENALLSGMCIMHSDACVTDEAKRKCSTIHQKLRKAMKKLLLRRLSPTDADKIIKQIEDEVCTLLYTSGVPSFSQACMESLIEFGDTIRAPAIVTEWLHSTKLLPMMKECFTQSSSFI